MRVPDSTAPASFTPKGCHTGIFQKSYDILLLTPMVGGGVKSWIPDTNQPIRTQSIKGHLRFWWRASRDYSSVNELKSAEDAIWGNTAKASPVRISVTGIGDPVLVKLERDDKGYVVYEDLPPYVLFPLQGQVDQNDFTLIGEYRFQMSVECPVSFQGQVENAIKLWILFGGIGARTRRGCGSLYCQEIMDAFSSKDDVTGFIRKFQNSGVPIFSTSPYPLLANCRFALKRSSNQNNAISCWASFLNRYCQFRQGANVARRPGVGSRPGRTYWPEADAIRRLNGNWHGKHRPEHQAGNWFPRGAYGLPILIEFKNEPTDPVGIKFMLQPKGEGRDRWPSPMILKAIRLGNGELFTICLILNHQLPKSIELAWNEETHGLTPNEMPLSSMGKAMPANAPLHSEENPYKAIIRHLDLEEIKIP